MNSQIYLKMHLNDVQQRSKTRLKRKATKQSKKVIFGTYQSSKILSKAFEKNNTIPDLLIADEAHRTTGLNKNSADDKSFSLCLDDQKFKCRKTL